MGIVVSFGSVIVCAIDSAGSSGDAESVWMSEEEGGLQGKSEGREDRQCKCGGGGCCSLPGYILVVIHVL